MQPNRRHQRAWKVLRFIARPFVCAALHFTPERVPDIDAPVLVLANHNTDFDPVLVALSFPRQMYFVASEHVFRWGFLSRLIVYLGAPIPLIKGRSDAHAALGILKALRGGQNVCIFAEGNRSVDGVTAPISPATGLLLRSGADLVTYRLEGGYFTHPRWGRSMRRGRMRGQVVGHYPAAALKAMHVDEINAIIRRDLHEDAYARQALEPVAFRGRRIAEHLETALYLCPRCNRVGCLKSKKNRFTCTCGLSLRFSETGLLEGEDAPFSTVKGWYAWQLGQVERLLEEAGDGAVFTDAAQRLYSVALRESAVLLDTGELSMTRGALKVGGHVFALEDLTSMAIVGQMTLTFSLHDGSHYEIKSDAPRSAYKYLNLFDALRAR